MIKHLLKKILFPIILLLGIQQINAQWTNVLVENFNGLVEGSNYATSGGTPYWTNNSQQNNLISNQASVGGTIAYTSQLPTAANGGRFLYFFTSDNVIPAAENTFFKKTISVIPGRTYRISFSYVAMNNATPGNVTLRARPAGNTTILLASPTYTINNLNWANAQSVFTVPTGVTSVDLTWDNTVKTGSGNDFGFDNVLVEQAVDSDGDGIPDYIDLDDDNDGILDTIEDACETEGSPIYNNNFGTGNTRGQDTNVLGHTFVGTGAIGDGSYALTTSAAATETYNKTDLTGNLDAGNPVITAGTTGGRYLMININSPGTVNQPIYRVSNLAVNVGTRYKFRIDMAGLANGAASIPNLQLSIRDLNGNFLASANSGSINMANDDVWRRLSLAFTATTSSVILEIVNLQSDGNGNDVGIDNIILTPIFPCDSDGDGVPNSLDLDSDGDGCADAIEGAANIATSQLVTAGGTVTGGGTSVNQNLCATGTCVNASGVPQFATLPTSYSNSTGQAIGQSQDASKNDCIDSDADGIPDWQDLDDDNDGILDCVENGLSAATVSSIFKSNGNAVQINANEVQLTPDTTGQSGNIWSYGKVDFGKSFTLSASVYLGTKDVAGADGLAAVFHNSPLGVNAIGESANGLGARNIANGLVLEVDTYNNGSSVGDLVNDHGQIWVSTNQAGAGLLTPAVSLGNVEDGAWHPMVITWNFVTKTLSYTVDGITAGTYTFPAGTPITSYFGGASKVYFGYTASTGDSTNDQRVRFVNFCSDLPIELDTDGDGIPNHLDLDSDNDGCTDAIEGGANFTTANLVIATGTISSQTPNQNLGNTVGNTATTMGVPTIAGTGQSIGQSQNAGRNDCIDSDGDGIPDWQDLDDDNDGILDTDENCNPYLAQNITGAWNGATASNLTVNLPGVVFYTPPTTPVPILDYENKYYTFGAGGSGNYYKDGNVSFTYTFSTPVPANEIAFHMHDLDAQFSNGAFPMYQINVNGAAANNNFYAVNYYTGGTNYMTYNSLSGALTVADNNLQDYGIILKGRGGQLISSITITSTNVASGDRVAYSLFSYKGLCDTDGDGIPNHLDLDSDNDGCPDAIEGGADITTARLVNAGGTLKGGNGTDPVVTPTSGSYNQSVLLNLCATTTCVNGQGVPQLSPLPTGYSNTTGQTIGDSQNALVNLCYCYKRPVLDAGTSVPVQHGITALSRANSGTSEWPVVRQSAWTVLEAQTKGFVVNKVAFEDADNNATTPTTPVGIPTANYVEGMMVYDTVANCLKIYNGTIWNCYSTQTCPQ